MASGSGLPNILTHIPSTKEIASTLENVRKEIHTVEATTVLDGGGMKILDDTEQLVSDTEKLVLEKNPDDKIQKLIIEGQRASDELQQQAMRLKEMESETLAHINSGRLRQLAEETLRTARLAGIEILSSGSFRHSCVDFVDLASDIIGDVVVEVATGEAVAVQDKDKGKERIGLSETEKIATSVKEGAEVAINTGLEMVGSEQRVGLDDEQIKALAQRFDKVIENISKRERTKKVFNGILEIFRLLGSEGEELTEETKEQLQLSINELARSQHINKTLTLAKELFEQFTGKGSLDPLIHHLKAVFEILANDLETLGFFDDLRGYILRVLSNTQLLQHPDQATVLEGRQLVARGRRLRDHPVFDELRSVLDQTKHLVSLMEQDPATLKLKEDMNKLVADLILDSDGNIVWKPEIMDQLRLILMSSIMERLKVPVPTIHMEDEDIEFTATGLVIALRNLVPDRVTIENRGKVILNLSDVQQPEVAGAGHAVRIILENINLHMPDADVWFRRKKFPRIEDEGKARLDIGGRGMDIAIVLRTYLRPDQLFTVENVACNVHNLELTLSDTKHDFLYNTLLRLFNGTLKNEIEGSIENTIRNSLEQLNGLIAGQISVAKRAVVDLPTITGVARSALPGVETAVERLRQSASAVVSSVVGTQSSVASH